jgi:hypothetical protein
VLYFVSRYHKGLSNLMTTRSDMYGDTTNNYVLCCALLCLATLRGTICGALQATICGGRRYSFRLGCLGIDSPHGNCTKGKDQPDPHVVNEPPIKEGVVTPLAIVRYQVRFAFRWIGCNPTGSSKWVIELEGESSNRSSPPDCQRNSVCVATFARWRRHAGDST